MTGFAHHHNQGDFTNEPRVLHGGGKSYGTWEHEVVIENWEEVGKQQFGAGLFL
jgi:hypothetical protein